MSAKTSIIQSDETNDIALGMIGLGYVGILLALAAAQARIKTSGFDLDRNKIRSFKNSLSYIKHVPDLKIKTTVEEKKFIPSSEIEDNF